MTEFLDELVQLAATGHGSCALTVRLDEKSRTVASSDALAARADEIQYAQGEGPCLEAMRTGAVVDAAGSRHRRPVGQLPQLRTGAGGAVGALHPDGGGRSELRGPEPVLDGARRLRRRGPSPGGALGPAGVRRRRRRAAPGRTDPPRPAAGGGAGPPVRSSTRRSASSWPSSGARPGSPSTSSGAPRRAATPSSGPSPPISSAPSAGRARRRRARPASSDRSRPRARRYCRTRRGPVPWWPAVRPQPRSDMSARSGVPERRGFTRDRRRSASRPALVERSVPT